jgi:5'-3' exonuclease
MGVPTLLTSIIKNKYYKNVHSGVKEGSIDCDYFFLDYNGIVYKAYERIKKEFEGKNLNKNAIEDIIIEEVIAYTIILICDVVKPKKYSYISMDGPCPRAKMVQQRSRRYKGYYDKVFMQEIKKKMSIPIDSTEWDRSANISPGTEFMQKLSTKLLEIIKAKGFSKHNPNMKVVISDSNVPGEGEQKILPFIRNMKKKKSTENLKCYIYGSDGDLIVLAVATHKNNLHIIRETSEIYEIANQYEDYRFIHINVDNLRNGFNHDLTRTFKNHSFDKTRILNDYIFLTFLVGNDFVVSLPFLKIKRDGLKTLIAIYHDIKLNHNDYLIDYDLNKDDIPKLNIPFFKELILEISKKEDFLMKKQQKEINSLLNGYKDPNRLEKELTMTPFEIFQSRYIHLQVCSPDHPLFEKYHEEFKKIDYNKDHALWKEDFYKYYLNIDKSNMEEYSKILGHLIENYLESLMFNLKYYYIGVPSWNWHYKFRTSPLLSDVYDYLTNDSFNINNINNIHFEEGKPYTPFEQLMLILPPQMNSLLPKPLRPIMDDDKLLCTQFYPIDFKLDITIGLKTMYSESILPEIDENILLPVIEKYVEKCSKTEKERNMVVNRAKMG